MQYSIAVYLPLFAGLANAGKIAFLPGTQSAVCGFNGGFCDQPTCYAEVVDVHGCSGQTDMWGGDCIGGPSTLSESICGSAATLTSTVWTFTTQQVILRASSARAVLMEMDVAIPNRVHART